MFLLLKIVNVLNVTRKKPKLQSTLPPENPPIINPKGPFCIKAFCEISEKVDFTGFDSDYQIVDETKNMWDKYSKGRSLSKCSDVTVSIVPIDNIENCKKHVVLHNKTTDITSLIFP